MKANRSALTTSNEEAVSPVIAVILMVAITVVLAATVFVLVNDLGKNVGSTGPALGLVSDSAGSSTSKWTVKVSSATQLADLSDFRYILTTAQQGQIVVSPTSSSFTTPQVWYAEKGAPGTENRTDAGTTDDSDPDEHAYQITFMDIDGNGKFSVGDTVSITYDDDDATAGFDNSFPSGEYSLEILHTPSGSSAASLQRTF